MPAIESEAKARTKKRFEEVFQSYDVKNKPKKKTPPEEQIVLDTFKNQSDLQKETVIETTIKNKLREQISVDDKDTNVDTKEHKTPKGDKKKKKKKVAGAEWSTTSEPVLGSPDLSHRLESETIVTPDRPQPNINKKNAKAPLKGEIIPDDFDDEDQLLEAYRLQVSQEETDEIKEKIKKKLKAHLSEHSLISETQPFPQNNETTMRRKKKKQQQRDFSTPEAETRSPSDLQDQSKEPSIIPNQSQVSQDYIENFSRKSKKIKKKSKADDGTRIVPEGDRQEDIHSRRLYDDNLVLGVYIHRCDKIKIDLMTSRPMVKIHIFDQNTGEYIKKENRTDLVSPFTDRDKQEYILPVLTQAYDFKRFKSPFPEWDEQIIFNERFAYFLQESEESPNVILFFEILDISSEDGASTLLGVQSQEKGFQRIAWAFLKLVGTNKVLNVDTKLRLQLYHPPSRSRISSTTHIYEWWLKHPRNRYPSTLYVTVKGLKVPDNVNRMVGSNLALQHDLGSNMSENDASLRDTDGKQKKDHFRWTRLPGQACRIPNNHLLSLHAGHKGCFSVRFSNDGRTLAAACSCRDSYPVYLYEIPSGQFLRELHGHLNVVYDLSWSKDDQHLLSSSSDGTVRLWRIGIESPSAVKVLPHPSFVYAAKFHPTSNHLVVTGCYDAVIRVWNVKVKEVNGQLLQEFHGHKSYINTLCFDAEGLYMYSGDSSGLIIMWNAGLSGSSKHNPLEHWTILKEIREADMKGIPVTHLEVHPNGRRLLIHAKDSTLRVMDLRIQATKKYIGTTNYREKIHSAFTPCGTFLFAGSEDGITYVWNTETGDQVAKYSELSYTTPIRDVAFHPHENMVAFCAFGPSQPVLVYNYDYKVAQMEAEAVRTSSEIPALQESYVSSAERFADVARTSMRMMKVKQKLDSVLTGSNTSLPAPSLLSPHSKIRLPGTQSTHLVTQPFSSSQHGGFSPVGRSLSRTPSIRLQMSNTDAKISSLKIEADGVLPIQETAVALYDYTAHRSDELTIHRSDIIHVLYKDNDNWWFGSLENGQQGYFPANYVATENHHEVQLLPSVPNSTIIHKDQYEAEESSSSNQTMSAVLSKSKDLQFMSQHYTDVNSPVTHGSRKKIQHLLEHPDASSSTCLIETKRSSSSGLNEQPISSQDGNGTQRKKKASKHVTSAGRINNGFEPDT
ncbi:jouberin [Pelodytes ibericus]